MKYKRILTRNQLLMMRKDIARIYVECDTYNQFKMKRDLRFPNLPLGEKAKVWLYHFKQEHPVISNVVLGILMAFMPVVVVLCMVYLTPNLPLDLRCGTCIASFIVCPVVTCLCLVAATADVFETLKSEELGTQA